MQPKFSDQEKRQLERARQLVRQGNVKEARAILLSMPLNKTAQTWLARLDTRYPTEGVKKKPTYESPQWIQLAQLRCNRCDRMLGDEVVACPQRPLACTYELIEERAGTWKQATTGFTFGTVIILIAVGTLFVQDTSRNIASTLILGVIGLFIFYGSILQALGRKTIIKQPQTGETWFRSTNVKPMYAPQNIVPDCVKQPPKPAYALSHPASLVALHDAHLQTIWAADKPVSANDLAYVVLVSILHLVSQGSLQIGYMPLFANPIGSKQFSQIPNSELYLTAKQRQIPAQGIGILEMRLLQLASQTKTPSQHRMIGVPVTSLWGVVQLLIHGYSPSSRRHNRPFDYPKARRRMFNALLHDAKRFGLVEQNGRKFVPSTPTLSEVDVLADLVKKYDRLDPALIAMLARQIEALMTLEGARAQLNWWLNGHQK